MTTFLAAVFALVSTAAPAPQPNVSWSPDGHWVAYVLAASAPEPAERPWLFAIDPSEPQERLPAGCPHEERLWATNLETRESVLLATVNGTITTPSWKMDGSALAYGCLTVFPEGKARYEIVVQDAPDHRNVLLKQEFDRVEPAWVAHLQACAPSWRPDDRVLAAPVLAPVGLHVLKADTGEVLAKLEGARAPAWSADGKRMAYYVGDDGLSWLDSQYRTYHRDGLLAPTHALPPPIWCPDRRSVLVVLNLRPRTVVGQAPKPTAPIGLADLVRVDLDSPKQEQLLHLVQARLPGSEPPLAFPMACRLGAEGDQLFYSLVQPKQPTQLAWCYLQTRAVRSRFHPLDVDSPIWGISIHPKDGGQIGLRFGPDGTSTLAAICDPLSQVLTPLVPEDADRLAWLSQVLALIRDRLREQPARTEDGTALQRYALLPAPRELASSLFPLPRVRHLARIGGPLCDRPAGADVPSPATQAVFDQARLICAYLEFDPDHPTASYRRAREALEAASRWASTPDERAQMLCLQAQIDIGLGDVERARSVLASLRQLDPEKTEQVEESATGFEFSSKLAPVGSWLAQLDRDAEFVGKGTGTKNKADDEEEEDVDSPALPLLRSQPRGLQLVPVPPQPAPAPLPAPPDVMPLPPPPVVPVAPPPR